ncbi:MAG: helix-turn-helix domain-containing protein [Cytophaga sp.]|uniref:helix-turn-helix domain-containing protein n=1 Tax=Cytophaga sp. TaxID=29535 RepID=UPI003F7FA94F
MDINIAKKIKAIREELGYSQTDFSKHLSIPQSYLSAIEAGKKTLTVKFCSQIHDQFNVNMNWLLSNSGNMFESKESAISEMKLDLSKETSEEKKVDLTLTLSVSQLKSLNFM